MPPHPSSPASPPPSPTTVRALILALHDIRAVCLDGPYTLKSGLQSPIYLDLRALISFPSLLSSVCRLMADLLAPLTFDLICGVPYTALPIATLLSHSLHVPMIMRRKEVKAYGLRKAIEGVWDRDTPHRCLIVEDLVTSGLSVFETVQPIQEEGVEVRDVVVIIDREQGGRANIEQRGCRLHAVMTISEVVRVLVEEGRIGRDKGDEVMAFIHSHRMQVSEDEKGSLSAHQSTPTFPRATPPAPLLAPPRAAPPRPSSLSMSYEARAAVATNAAAASLLRLMQAKQSNLCLSADVLTASDLLALADACGPHICALKTHIDIIEDFTPSLIPALQELATRHRFLLFEDRKFADIGSTVAHQYHHGVYRISAWAHIINAHLLPGKGIIEGLSTPSPHPSAPASGLLLIAQMSSAGSLITDGYTAECVKVAEEGGGGGRVMGFICQSKLSDVPGLLHMTPGVSRVEKGDAMGQQYNGVDECVQRGADVLIVGRGIYGQNGKEAEEAKRYQKEGWAAYLKRIDQAPPQ